MAIHIRRREFIVTLGSAVAVWPLVARAQQPEQVRRIGVLMGYAESDLDAQAWYAAFREGLQKLGWMEGRDTQIDTRWATPADAESMRRSAKELVALRPDLLLSSTTPTTTALLQQTRTIPIVFAIVADPIVFLPVRPRVNAHAAALAALGAALERWHLEQDVFIHLWKGRPKS